MRDAEVGSIVRRTKGESTVLLLRKGAHGWWRQHVRRMRGRSVCFEVMGDIAGICVWYYVAYGWTA